MGYSIMFQWAPLPVATFVISLLIGKNNYMGRWKCFFFDCIWHYVYACGVCDF